MDSTIRGEDQKPSKTKGSRLIIISVSAAIIILLASLQFSRGLLVVATVNGSPISRWAVIGNLEKQAGKQVLDSLITEKLIESKLGQISVSKEEIDSEIKKIEQQVASQGATMDVVLKQQGMTMEQLQEQITMRKKLEKLLTDKAQISDEEVNTYIKDNKVTPKNGEKPEEFKAQVKAQLQQQKFDQLAQQWIGDLKNSAKIKYYVNY